MKSLLNLLFLLPVIFSFGQNGFPATWEGKWKGTLEIHAPIGKVQELPMELHILPIGDSGHFTWTIIYGEDKEAGKRPYELIPLDPAKGLYAIDEKNSIRMEGYLLGGKFHQWFEVEGSLLVTTTWLDGEALYWEITVSGTKPVSVTGGQEWEGNEIPPVKTFPVLSMQRARLVRG